MIFNGLSVLTEDPNRRDTVSQQFSRSKTRIESPTGTFTEISRATASRQSRSFNWFMQSRADIGRFRAFMTERAGRLVPFYVPTWHHDLRLDHDAVAGNTLTVQNIGYTRYQFDTLQTWRRYLTFIQIGSGISFIRRIDNAVESGTTTETITLDSSTGIALAKTEWMLSFLTLCRLESDQYTLHWHLPTVAECAFEIREIPLEMPQVPAT